ncbi:hypothetical protein ACFE04_018893 [Oxalis oulophora]
MSTTAQLDLDSFLNSSDSEVDAVTSSVSIPHRTVDDILNDSDSSTSPSPPHRLDFLLSSVPQKPDFDAKPQSWRTPNNNHNNQSSNNSNSTTPLNSNSRPRLPSLFGGVRSNAKPGAALAAAAAASRSLPTPHAAAIKSRRRSLQKVSDASELGSVCSDDHENNSTSVSVSGDADVDESIGDLQSSLNSELTRHDEVDDVKEDDLVHVDGYFGGKGFMDNENPISKSSTAPPGVFEQLIDASTAISDCDNAGEGNFESDILSKKSDAILDENDSNQPSPSAGVAVNDTTIENDAEDSGRKGNEGGDSNSDEGSSTSDISDLVEERIEQLEVERINKLEEEKKLRSLMKPLELAEELEKKMASTGLDLEEGAAAQPMRLEGVRRGSTTLGYFDVKSNNSITQTLSSQAFKRDHGSPQVLAVHLNYIAVGMSRGVIIVVPSKYNAYSSENLDSKILMLGLQGDRSYATVTSMCFNLQGDLLLAGYGDGHITLWDMQRASAAKIITGEHNAPIVHAFFLGQDSQVARQFKAITGDIKGVVQLLTFSESVVPLLNRFSVKTQCLLDGQKTGMVLSASPLLFNDSYGGALLASQGNATTSTSSIGSMMGGVVGGDGGWKFFNEGPSLIEEGVVVFVTHQILVVRLTPKIEVYAQLPRPDGVREGSIPYTAWRSMVQNRSTFVEGTPTEAATERVSLLAIAWDRKVQVAKLVKSELKVYGKWSLDSAAIGVTWLDDQMLVVLTSAAQIYLFAKDGTVIHQTSFAIDGSRGDDLISYHTNFVNVFGNPEKAYHNCISVRGASVYILGPTHLIVSRLLLWRERIQVLRNSGDWMGALNMAMTIYDGQAHGVIDLPRTLDAAQEAIMPYLVELLSSYVNEVFSYISVAFCNQLGKVDQLDESNSRSSSSQSEIKEQFTRVGGVAVEFCVHINRTDILFDEIFSKFLAVQHRDTFLELLERYILKDMLGSLPPEIMQALVEHYSSKGWLQRVEQCVLHMDISSLDFNQVVILCREHGLFGALIYLFNKGLDDFRAPLEELLAVLRNSTKRETSAALGYRMLVYLKYCFSGLSFPPGHGYLSKTRLPSLRTELVQLLLESDSRNPHAATDLSFKGRYLNVYYLLELDTEATLDVMKYAFIEDYKQKLDGSADGNVETNEETNLNLLAETQNALIQDTINTLCDIIDKNISRTDEPANGVDVGSWPSKKDISHLFDFITYYVACGRSTVSKSVLGQILDWITSETDAQQGVSKHRTEKHRRREKQLLSLLQVVPETDWNKSYVLNLCENAHFYQVCGLIHTVRHQNVDALDSYMKDVDEPVYAFSFISNLLLQLNGNERAAFRSAIISRIPTLVDLSREGTFVLVIDHFHEESSQILSELRSHPKSLFLYLKTAIEVHLSGSLDFSYLKKEDTVSVSNGRMVMNKSEEELKTYFERISDFPKLLISNPINVTDEMIELYLELLCQFERYSVLKFLETFDSYRVEHCLRLCQEYGITDAAAFLLERVGDVGSALLLVLSGLNDKFIELETAVGKVVSSKSHKSKILEQFDIILNMKEVHNIHVILQACIGLCQRNTPRLNPEESETLWFKLLDLFCKPLMESYNDKSKSEAKNHAGTTVESWDSQDDEELITIKWKISKSMRGAHVLRKLFSQFIKEIVESMVGYVHLPTIMSKLLSDNGSQEFGDFKLTILGMLGTYGFERRILDTAKSLIEDDTFYTMSVLKKGASHGYAPRSMLCCICNCLLTKTSVPFRIRVFNCGHATHLQCELLENETSSRSPSSGCPVCMPKKNSQKSKNKSVLAENGLFSKSPRQQPTQGSPLYSHESDPFESSYGLQQIPRFEILANLQNNQKLVQIETIPQLKLAPPVVYHEKVKRGTDVLTGGSSNSLAKTEKPNRKKQLRDLKVKGSPSSLRFPLKSTIFGEFRNLITLF